MKNSLVVILLLFSNHLFAAAGKAPWVGFDLNGLACTGGETGYGPYDYTKASERPQIPIVEDYHFTPEVEQLVAGKSGHLTTDLDYTLRAIPNHHRALLSGIRYQFSLNDKLRTDRPLVSTIECYLQRAMHFSPQDATTVSIFAYYLKKINLLEKAGQLYKKALEIAPNNAKIAYSYGMLLIDLKRYDEAAKYAKVAYRKGRPPQELKNKLIKLGAWKE